MDIIEFISTNMVNTPFNGQSLKDAYGMMPMDSQPWAKHSSKELQFIATLCGNFDDKLILDAGCGQGRHTLALLDMGKPKLIHGVDMSPLNIQKALEKKPADCPIEFHIADLREYDPGIQYDIVLCLYDVIGSFPEAETNEEILRNLHRNCAIGGHVVLSVMNFELTLANVLKENYGDIQNNPRILFNLPPSNTMQATGDVFDPKHYAIDSVTKLVYRKEQFQEGDALHAEYVIRDKRYSRTEIEELAIKCGFHVDESRYVQAGRWDKSLKPTDSRAKEILLILTKV